MTMTMLNEPRVDRYAIDDYLARMESAETATTTSRSGLVRALGLLALTIGLVALTAAVQSVALLILGVPIAVLVTADAFTKVRTEEFTAL